MYHYARSGSMSALGVRVLEDLVICSARRQLGHVEDLVTVLA